MKKIKREVDESFLSDVVDQFTSFLRGALEREPLSGDKETIDISPWVDRMRQEHAASPERVREIEVIAEGYLDGGGMSYGFLRKMHQIAPW